MKVVIGKLINVSNRFWFFETEDGETLSFVFEAEHNIPVETKIALSIPDEPEADGRYSIDPTDDMWTFINSGPVVAAATSGPVKKHIALYYQKNYSETDDKALEKATEAAEGLYAFYKKYAGAKWDLEVRPFLYKGACYPEPPYYCMMDIGNSVDTGDFKPNYHHVYTYHANSSYCGLGNVSGDKGVTYRGNGNCGLHTIIHELGHNFGLNHANEDGKEYYDTTCVMGRGPAIPGLNGPHLEELGLEEPIEVIEINQTTQLLMCPVELDKYCLHEDEYQHVHVLKDGHPKLYLTMRKDKGWPYNPATSSTTGGKDEYIISVHKRDSGKTDLIYRFGPNTTNPRLPNGVKVVYHEYSNETARITLDYNDGVVPAELTMPTTFPTPIQGVELDERHNGLWYDPQFWGQGFDIQVRNGKVVLLWYTFNQEPRSPSVGRWYIGEANLGGGAETFDIYTTKDGTFENPTLADRYVVGQGQLYFFNDYQGRFMYNTEEHGRGTVNIRAIARNNRVLSGVYFDPARDKEGFSVQAFDNQIVMYWYTYGPNIGGSFWGSKDIFTQRWYMFQGPSMTNLTLYELVGGKFLQYDKPELQTIGAGQLKVEGDKLRVSYNSEKLGNSSLLLTRLL